MVINDFDICLAGGSVGPLKTNPPLAIDAGAVLALTIIVEGFRPVAPTRTILAYDLRFR
jgi:hypothetical protein